jgi:uncharacterized DUF497 family protein
MVLGSFGHYELRARCGATDRTTAVIGAFGSIAIHDDFLVLQTAAVIPDDRYPYGEARFRAYGWMDGRLHMLAFTMRGDALRAISFRKANAREAKLYGQKTRAT